MKNLSVIEDDHHFFFECETFETLRQIYFEIWHAKKKNVLSIAKYLVNAFDMWNEINN